MTNNNSKNTWSSKLQSYVLIERNKGGLDIILSKKDIVIQRNDGKKQTFIFDAIVENRKREELLPLMNRSIQLIRLGFNFSVYVNGHMNHQDKESLEMMIVKNQIEKLFQGFENDNKNAENGIQSVGEILLKHNISISCYEVFDNRLIDLSLSSSDEVSGKNTAGTLGNIRKIEKNIGVSQSTVTNRVKTICPTLELAMTIVTQAMQMRMFLSTNKMIELPPSQSKLVGAIGTLFIVVDVEQLVYTISSGESKTRESTLEIVLFANAEVLAFKPESPEAIQAVQFNVFNPSLSIPGLPEDIKQRNSKLLTALLSGLQSFSTLTRVVNALKMESTSSEGPIRQHIPYRDSLLTRLLQPSLQGNCNVIIVSAVSTTHESLTRILQFASRISSLYNNIWENFTPGQSTTCQILPVDLQRKLKKFIKKAALLAKAEMTVVTTSEKSEVIDPKQGLDTYDSNKSIPISPSQHMVEFNDMLSEFQASLLGLSKFSSSFELTHAEKERDSCLLGYGITSVRASTFEEDEDELSGGEDGYKGDNKDFKWKSKRRMSKDEVVWGKVELLSTSKILPKLQTIVNHRNAKGDRINEDSQASQQSGSSNNSSHALSDNVHVEGELNEQSTLQAQDIDGGSLRSQLPMHSSDSSPTAREHKFLTIQQEFLNIDTIQQSISTVPSRSIRNRRSSADSPSTLQKSATTSALPPLSPSKRNMNMQSDSASSNSSPVAGLLRRLSNRTLDVSPSPTNQPMIGIPRRLSQKVLDINSDSHFFPRNEKNNRTSSASGGRDRSSPVLFQHTSDNDRPIGDGNNIKGDGSRVSVVGKEKGHRTSSADRMRPNGSDISFNNSSSSPYRDVRGREVISVKDKGSSNSNSENGTNDKRIESTMFPVVKATRNVDSNVEDMLKTGTQRQRSFKKGNNNDSDYDTNNKTSTGNNSSSTTGNSSITGSRVGTASIDSQQNRNSTHKLDSNGLVANLNRATMTLNENDDEAMKNIDYENSADNNHVLDKSAVLSSLKKSASASLDEVIQSRKLSLTSDDPTLRQLSISSDSAGGVDGGGVGGKKAPKRRLSKRYDNRDDAITFPTSTPASTAGSLDESDLEIDLQVAAQRTNQKLMLDGVEEVEVELVEGNVSQLKMTERMKRFSLGNKFKDSFMLGDDRGDNLSDLEQRFLRAVGQTNGTNASECLKEGADVRIKNGFGRDAMQIAARNGSIPMLALVNEFGGSIQSTGPNGDGLFHLAAFNGHLETMKWLRRNGILADAVDSSGQNAVHVAAKRCEPEILTYLNDQLNADFTLHDNAGLTPYECIARYGEDDDKKMRLAECRKIVLLAAGNAHMRSKQKEAAESRWKAKMVREMQLQVEQISKAMLIAAGSDSTIIIQTETREKEVKEDIEMNLTVDKD